MMIKVIVINNVIKILEEIMKLFTKVMAAALLSTALSTASMAAVDFTDLADAAKPADTKLKLKMAANTGNPRASDVTFEAGFVDAIAALDTSRFTNKQSKRLVDALKGIYADLTVVAGDASKLKAKLATPVLGTLVFDTSKADADYKNPVNAVALKLLADAVIDDPFKAVDAAAADLLSLKGTPSAGRATNNATYPTVGDMIAAFEAVKAKTGTGDKAALAVEGKAIVDAAAAAGFGTKARRYLGYLTTKEAKADFSVAEVRAAKAKVATAKDAELVAEKSKVKITPAQQVSIDAFALLMAAIDSGELSVLTVDGSAVDDSARFAASAGEAGKLVTALVDSLAAQRALTNDKTLLLQELATLKASRGHGGSSSGHGGGHDDHHDLGGGGSVVVLSAAHQEAVTRGEATFDPLTRQVKSAINGSVIGQY